MVLLKDVVHQDNATVRKAVDAIAVFLQAKIQLYVFFANVNAATVTGWFHIHAVTIPELLTDVEFNVLYKIFVDHNVEI